MKPKWVAGGRALAVVSVFCYCLFVSGVASAQQGNCADALEKKIDEKLVDMQQKVDWHIRASEKQVDGMRAALDKFIDAKFESFGIWWIILPSAGAAALAFCAYVYRVLVRLQAAHEKLDDSVKLITASDVRIVHELLRARQSAMLLLCREHLHQMTRPEFQGMAIQALESVLRDILVLADLYSGQQQFVDQAVSQIKEADGVMKQLAKGILAPLQAIYGKMDARLKDSIAPLE